MAELVETFSFEHLRERYLAGLSWLRGSGAPPPEGSRFLYYSQVLDELVAVYKDGTREQVEDRFAEFSDVLFETDSFVQIYDQLKEIPARELRRRLQLMVGGPNRREQEVDDDGQSVRPRNEAFELTVAARFARAGMHISLVPPADVTVTFDNRKIYVECKRCRAPRKIVGLLNEAVRQCGMRVDGSPSKKASGIAVVDFSVAVNPEVQTVTFEDQASASTALKEINRQFVHEFVPQTPLEKRPAILGILVRYSAMIVTERKLLTPAQEWAFVQNSALGDDRRELMEAVSKQLQATTTANTNRSEGRQNGSTG